MTDKEKYSNFDKNFSLEGKVAIITGASSGIGTAITKLFADKGAKIVAVDLKKSDEVETYIKNQGAEYIYVLGDLADEKFRGEKVTSEAVKAFNRIDVLVNCAGIGGVNDMLELPQEVWDRIIAVNLTAPVFLGIAAAKEMKKTGGGSIINITSQAGIVALQGHISYGSAKAGLIYATKQMAMEWGKYGIRANCVSPTVILTPMGEKDWNNARGDEFKTRLPLGRFGYPEEVAAYVAFLASDASRLSTGSNFVCDAGLTCHGGPLTFE